jgi:hypothetical protein
VDQLYRSTLIAQSYIARDELAQAGRVNMCNACEVQKNPSFTFSDKAANRFV